MAMRDLFAVTAATLLVFGSSIRAQERAPQRESHETSIENQVEIAKSMADHEAVAQSYDAEANQFDKDAARHERLATLYRSGVGPRRDAASLAAHCDRIAKSLKASASEARELARIHRDISHNVSR